MALRCKPGDLCVIVNVFGQVPGTTPLLGRYCTTLHLVPVGRRFVLPDGFKHEEVVNQDRWVVEFQNPITVLQGNSTRQAKYGVVPDSRLMPQRPGPDAVDEEAAEPVPSTEKEPA